MKVKAPGETITQEAIQIARANAQGKGLAKKDESPANPQRVTGEDTVNVQVGKLIQDLKAQFDSDENDPDRKKRIEALKAAIKSGKYNPNSTDVARAVKSEIDLEIATDGGSVSEILGS